MKIFFLFNGEEDAGRRYLEAKLMFLSVCNEKLTDCATETIKCGRLGVRCE